MSTFTVPVVRLSDVRPHLDADNLDIARVYGTQSIVQRGAFKAGDIVVYIPEGAIVPAPVLERLGLTGKLAGKGKDRVKAVRLRGALSNGLCLGGVQGANTITIDGQVFPLGFDAAEALGIKKYEPVVPANMAGEVRPLHGYTRAFDIEHLTRHEGILREDEEVVVTEKLHGTYIQIGYFKDMPAQSDLFSDGRMFVTSKGMGRQGLVLKNNGSNAKNLYVRALKASRLEQTLPYHALIQPNVRGLIVMGEVFGDVQDLKYGHEKGSTALRLFDVLIIFQDGREEFMPHRMFEQFVTKSLGLEIVPVLYLGEWSTIRHRMNDYSIGDSTLAPGQIREGAVVRTNPARSHPSIGRVILKDVSDAYLTRKEGTEFN